MDPDIVRYQRDGAIARVTMNRPEYRNAQNSAMTYALDDAFYRAAGDDEVTVFGLHHLAHAHNAEVGTDSLAGHDARTMRDARQEAED